MAISSGFSTWFGAVVTAGIMVAGISVIGIWHRAQTELDEVLKLRYKFLRGLEERKIFKT